VADSIYMFQHVQDSYGRFSGSRRWAALMLNDNFVCRPA